MKEKIGKAKRQQNKKYNKKEKLDMLIKKRSTREEIRNKQTKKETMKTNEEKTKKESRSKKQQKRKI